MSNPQGLKDLIKTALAEKGDYTTLAHILQQEEELAMKHRLLDLIEPFSQLAQKELEKKTLKDYVIKLKTTLTCYYKRITK